MNDALKLVNLTKKFPNGVTAVDNVSLTVPHGSVYGFLGRNGAGKTTTLKMITGLSNPTSGEIYIYGNKVEFGKPLSYKNIGFLPDVPEFYSYMTAREYLFLCGRLHKMKDNEIKNRINDIFNLINFDRTRLRSKISTYSRGMKQKLGIAVALLHSPDLILLDEPTSALDPIGRKETMNIINLLKGKYTILFSSHILSDVERVCDRVAVIEKGSLVLEGGIKEIKAQNEKLTEILNVLIFIKNNIQFVNFLEEIRKLDFLDYLETDFDKIHNYGNGEEVQIKFRTTDRQKSGDILPGLFAKYDLQLIHYEHEEPNFEDIFISATEDINNSNNTANINKSQEAAL